METCKDCLRNDVCHFTFLGNELTEQDGECCFFIAKADVAEVRHGEWKKVSEKYPKYVCTVCNHLYNNKEYKYCPNCGAKMDGKGDTE